MKKRRLVLIIVLTLWVALLILIVFAERGNSNAVIKTFWDAVWYSFVTMSTVGYGDYYPVTVWGKIIGIVFTLLSIGVLASMFGYVLSAVNGNLIPKYMFRRHKREKWYFFSQANKKTVYIAKELAKKDPKALFVFPEKSELEVPEEMTKSVLKADIFSTIPKWKKADECYALCFKPDMRQNAKDADHYKTIAKMVYAETDHVQDGIITYDACEVISRYYWNKYPLKAAEKNIVIIGDERLHGALFLQSILMNIRPENPINYEVIGKNNHFLSLHYSLKSVMNVNEYGLSGDTVWFDQCDWAEKKDELLDADRIIIALDDIFENDEIAAELLRNFPVKGRVFAYSDHSIHECESFGRTEEIYTPDMVIHSRLDALAVAMNDIYKKAMEKDGKVAPAWEELSNFVKKSNISAADHLFSKLRLLLGEEESTDLKTSCIKALEIYKNLTEEDKQKLWEIEHIRWMRFYAAFNWKFGNEKDAEKRRHPLMVLFKELPFEEQAKDDYAWSLLGELANMLKD